METQFDLDAAILSWREQLGSSRQFRKENLAELEAHLRDAVAHLQGTELSQEEAFMIATRRIGSVEELAKEFEKINRSPMNKVIHGFIFAFICISCWLLCGGLTLAEHVAARLLGPGRSFPGFTILCLQFRPVFYLIPVLAIIWCAIVWLRKDRNTWVGFFAVSASVIILTAIPTLIAMYLPLVEVLQTGQR